MKKSIIMLVTAVSFATLAFQSCKSNTDEEVMQKPIAEEASLGSELKDISASDAKVATTNNLMDAFKGESTASAKYLAYSKKAEEEGFHEIALLFATASKSEKNSREQPQSCSGRKRSNCSCCNSRIYRKINQRELTRCHQRRRL